MHLNKRGVALLQVLMVAAVLAGLATMILRVVTSRTLSARQIRQTVSAQMLVETCMKQVSNYWMERFETDPEGAAADLAACRFRSGGSDAHLWGAAEVLGVNMTCYSPALTGYTPSHHHDAGPQVTIHAVMSSVDDKCQIRYQIWRGVDRL